MKNLLRNRRQFCVGASASAALLAAQKTSGSDNSSPIRIGQIGVAHGHANKISIYRESADYEVVGICEPDDELRDQAKTQPAFRDLQWMSQEELLNVEGLQAVLVETRPRFSLAIAESCIAAGKHVHLDKPAGESLPQFERLLTEAQRQGLMVQMGYMYRYNPAILLLHEFLQNGWLGEIFEIHAVMSKVVEPASRRELAAYPGGMMYELGCHLIDLVVRIQGEPLKVDSYACRSSLAADGLQENMLSVLEYPHALASIKSSALEQHGFERRHLVVCGTEGTFHIQPLDAPSARIALARQRDSYRVGYQDVSFEPYSRYVGDAAEMAKIIRGQQEHRFSYAHDLAVQRTVLKACKLPLD